MALRSSSSLSLAAALLIIACLLINGAAADYPGVCSSSSSSSCARACPGKTCASVTGATPSTCGVDFYSGVPQINWPTTYCMPDFQQTCEQQPDCQRCTLWNIITNSCGRKNIEECKKKGSYAYLKAKVTQKFDNGTYGPLQCFTNNHWLVLPTRACAGIESADSKCTGSQGEKIFQVAFNTGVSQGFPKDGGDGVGSPSGRWVVLINAPNWRGQHQMHLHVAFVATSTPEAPVMLQYLAKDAFSTDSASPTVLLNNDTHNTTMVSVFIKAGRGAIKSKIQPFATAAAMANAFKPGYPYGIMLERGSQLNDKGKPVYGFILSLVYNFSDFEALDQSQTTDCSDGCRSFE